METRTERLERAAFVTAFNHLVFELHEKGLISRNEFAARLRKAADGVSPENFDDMDGQIYAAQLRFHADLAEAEKPTGWAPMVIQGGKSDSDNT